jgi:hypothetical protein
VPVPAGSHQEDRRALPGAERADDRVLRQGEVRGLVRLDEPHRARQVLPATQRTVDDEQIVTGGAVVSGFDAGGDRGVHLQLGEGALEREAQADRIIRAGPPDRIFARDRRDVAGVGRGGEQAAAHGGDDQVGTRLAAADHTARVRRADGRCGGCRPGAGRCAVVDPGSGFDAADPVDEEHCGRRRRGG